MSPNSNKNGSISKCDDASTSEKVHQRFRSQHQSLPKWKQITRKILIFMTIISFLTVGFWINIVQFILVLALKLSDTPKWRWIIRRINSSLLHVFYAPVIFLVYHWTNMDLNIQLANSKLIEDNKKPIIAVVVTNHSYELDYMICFALANIVGNIGSYKSISKDELKYVPIFGWCLWMTDMIFVKRNWKKDKLRLGKKLDPLFDYDQAALGIFAEGTRWTEEKHQASVEYALSKGLKPFKYHLFPRSRGFNYSVRHILRRMLIDKKKDPKLFKLLNMEYVMPERTRYTDWLNGQQLKVDVFCEEVEVNEEILSEIIKSENEDECPKLTGLLMNIYRRKDQLVEEYKANGNKFNVDPNQGGPFPIKQSLTAIIIWFLGFCCTYGTLGYLATVKYAHSYTFWTLLVGFIGICVLMIKRVEHESDATNSRLQVKKGKLDSKSVIKSIRFQENLSNNSSPAY